jgi:hypothetical protein
MRSTANWDDIRYREYTTSKRKAELFKKVPRIRFTDSGHHIIPVVNEHHGRRQPRNMLLQDHVVDAIVALSKANTRPPITKILEAALKPFVEAYLREAEPIGDSDLYDEQPRRVLVTLGDCRKAQRALWELEAMRGSSSVASQSCQGDKA